jgi:hypothetical protein
MKTENKQINLRIQTYEYLIKSKRRILVCNDEYHYRYAKNICTLEVDKSQMENFKAILLFALASSGSKLKALDPIKKSLGTIDADIDIDAIYDRATKYYSFLEIGSKSRLLINFNKK